MRSWGRGLGCRDEGKGLMRTNVGVWQVLPQQ